MLIIVKDFDTGKYLVLTNLNGLGIVTEHIYNLKHDDIPISAS